MTTKFLGSIAALMLAMPLVASAREVPPPDYRVDSRAPVTESMDQRGFSFEDMNCSVGEPVGWVAALAAMGLVLRPRRR